jgi:transcriptional regulator with XRE-family HTH domain
MSKRNVRPIDPVVRFDLRLGRLAEHLGVTLNVLCEESELSPNAAYNWCHGRCWPSVRSMMKLHRRWGLSLDWLMGLKSNDVEEAFLNRRSVRRAA